MKRIDLKQVLSRVISSKATKFSLVLFFGLGVSLIYQNCAEPLAVTSVDLTSKADTLPFGYEVKVDTLAYMSCSGGDSVASNNQGVFTFKVGSYGNANTGIGLSPAFVAATRNTRLSDQARMLSVGKPNRGAQLQVAIRGRNNLLQFVALDSNGIDGKDYYNMLAPLDSISLLEPIVQAQGEKIKYFGNISGTGKRRVEGYLYFNDVSETTQSSCLESISMQCIRQFFQTDSFMLTLGFVDIDGDVATLPMGPSEDRGKEAYGIGLRPTFTKGFGHPLPASCSNDSCTFTSYDVTGGGPGKVMSEIAEVDLLDSQRVKGTNEANWTCPANLKFMIVRPEDALSQNDVTCDTSFYEDPNTPPAGSTSESYFIARSILPVEYWHIDFKRRCIVPKEPNDSCYDKETDYDATPINYTPGLTDKNLAQKECGPDADERCPHYVSICYKTN